VVPPRYYAMVANPLVEGYEVTNFLMNGGSSLKTMYIETLEKLV
jgi:hypothetical protein